MHEWKSCGLAGLLTLLPATALAQTSAAAPRVSVGGGAGVAFPFSGEFSVTPVAWEAQVQGALARKVWIEGSVSEARRSRTIVATNLPGGTPSGVIGRLEQTSTWVQRSWQVNLLATRSAGRVRLSGGGGVGMLEYRRRTRTTETGCSAGEPCGTSEVAVSNLAGTVQGLGDLDARIAGRLSAYGRGVLIVPMRDAGSSEVRVTAGVRWRW